MTRWALQATQRRWEHPKPPANPCCPQAMLCNDWTSRLAISISNMYYKGKKKMSEDTLGQTNMNYTSLCLLYLNDDISSNLLLICPSPFFSYLHWDIFNFIIIKISLNPPEWESVNDEWICLSPFHFLSYLIFLSPPPKKKSKIKLRLLVFH